MLRCTAHTRGRTGADVETPLQHVSGAMPVGTEQQGRRRRIGEWGRQGRTHTPSSQLRAIRGSKPSKRRSVMEPRRSLVSQGSWVPGSRVHACVPWTGLPLSCPPASSLSLSPGRVCRHRSTIGRSSSRTVIALLPCLPGVCAPGLVPLCSSKVLKRIVTAARTAKRQGIRIAQHSPLLCHTDVSGWSDPCL